MASIVAPRVQHIGALADVTSNHNVPQVKPTGKDRKVRFVPTTRVTSPSTKKSKKTKYKPTMEEESYRKILSSPDPTALLNVGNVSIVSDTSDPPPSPNISKRRDKSGSSSRAATPTTPPVAKCGGEQLVAINESGVANLKTIYPITPTVSTTLVCECVLWPHWKIFYLIFKLMFVSIALLQRFSPRQGIATKANPSCP
jgi:hypothetical protein